MRDFCRLVIHITRGTNAGRALAMMANGISVVANSREKLDELYEQYLDPAEPILSTANKTSCFGIIAAVDESTGEVIRCQSLMGKALVVRTELGQPGQLSSTVTPQSDPVSYALDQAKCR